MQSNCKVLGTIGYFQEKICLFVIDVAALKHQYNYATILTVCRVSQFV